MKKSLLFSIILSLLFSSSTYAAEFTDLPNDHANYVSITQLSDGGILKGYDDGSFKPDKILNRVEALKVILEGADINSDDDVSESPFSDVAQEQWFAKYVLRAKYLGIVKGNPDGSFEPDRQVKRVEFIKMLLEANRFRKEKWEGQQLYNDIPGEAWYTPYMNYAGKAGLVLPDSSNNLNPEKAVTRAEMSEILYLMRIILRGSDTQFLVQQAELQMAQIELYIGSKNVLSAKRASELAYDLTQQALKNAPDNNVVLGAAKIAKAYDLLVNAFIAGLQDNTEEARTLAEQCKVKATEAWEINNEVQEIAGHIKARADEILSQL